MQKVASFRDFDYFFLLFWSFKTDFPKSKLNVHEKNYTKPTGIIPDIIP